MASIDIETILKVPARLILDPTDLTSITDDEFGGTPMGLAEERALTVVNRSGVIRAREYGGRITEIFEGARQVVLGVALRSWDVDAIAKILPGVTITTDSGLPRINIPASMHALGTDRAAVFVLAPLNTEDHPALIMYKGVASIAENAIINFSATRPFRIPIIIRALPSEDSGAKVAELGLIHELTG